MKAEQELLDTIEGLRKQKFPEIPAELVQHITSIERDFTDNRAQAYKQIAQLIDSYLERKGKN